MKYEVVFNDGTTDIVEGCRLWDTAGSVSVLQETGEYTTMNKPVYATVALYPLVNLLSIKEMRNA